MSKKILVTGGCGFVGSNLVPRLEKAGHWVRVLDSEALGRSEHLGTFEGEFQRGDIRDSDALDSALSIRSTIRCTTSTSMWSARSACYRPCARAASSG